MKIVSDIVEVSFGEVSQLVLTCVVTNYIVSLMDDQLMCKTPLCVLLNNKIILCYETCIKIYIYIYI